MAFEAMNNANYLQARMITVLNDNGQVSLPTGTPSAGGVVPSGALSAYTSRLISSKPFADFRQVAKGISSLFSLSATLLSGEPVELSQYAGCVCLVVNAASK